MRKEALCPGMRGLTRVGSVEEQGSGRLAKLLQQNPGSTTGGSYPPETKRPTAPLLREGWPSLQHGARP